MIADSTLAQPPAIFDHFRRHLHRAFASLSRLGEQQPEAFNAYGKRDCAACYGLLGRELIGWTQQAATQPDANHRARRNSGKGGRRPRRSQLANSARRSARSTRIAGDSRRHRRDGLGSFQRQTATRVCLPIRHVPREGPLRPARTNRRAELGKTTQQTFNPEETEPCQSTSRKLRHRLTRAR